VQTNVLSSSKSAGQIGPSATNVGLCGASRPTYPLLILTVDGKISKIEYNKRLINIFLKKIKTLKKLEEGQEP